MKRKIKHIKFTDEELQELKKSREDEDWSNSIPTETLKEYAGEYIAVKNKKIVAHSKSIDKLYEQIDGLGLNRLLISKLEGEALVIY